MVSEDAAPPVAEVVVTVERAEVASASVARVSARELRAVPHRTAEDALELVPGMTLVQHGSEGKGHQFLLRGFDAVHGADFEVSVDGIVINEWSNVHAQGYLDLGFVIPELIESVEVIKGPFGVEQGPFAMAGTARYRLGVAEEARGSRAAYTFGTTGRHRAFLGYSPASGDGSQFVGVELLHDEGFGKNRDIERGSALAKSHLFDSPALGRLSLLASAYAARFGLPGAIRVEDVEARRSGFYDSYDPSAFGKSRRASAALSYDWESPRWHFAVVLQGSQRQLDLLENPTGFLRDPVEGDRRSQRQRTHSVGLDTGVEAALTEKIALRAGLGIRADAFDQRQDHASASGASLAVERELDGVQALGHVRVGLSLKPTEHWRVQGGARFDLAHVDVSDRVSAVEEDGSLPSLSPRLGSELELSSAWTLFGAYGRGARPPEARAFSGFTPEQTGVDEELYPGSSATWTHTDSLELGARFRAHADVLTRASAFATFVQRESVFDHVSGINLELNATRRLGGELELQVWPSPWLELGANATLVDARFVESGNPIPFAPAYSAGLLALLGPRAGLSAGVRLSGIAPRPLPHGARGQTLFIADATVAYARGPLRMDLELENFLDLRLREGEYHFASDFRSGGSASRLPVLHYVAGPPLNARLTLTLVL